MKNRLSIMIFISLGRIGEAPHYFSESGHHERYQATYTGRSKNSWTHLIEALLPERYGLEIDGLLATAQRIYAFDTYDGLPLAEVSRPSGLICPNHRRMVT